MTAREAMKGKVKGKRKRKIEQYLTPRLTTMNVFIMQEIFDQFDDGWHKSNFIADSFVVRRIAALLGDGWHK